MKTSALFVTTEVTGLTLPITNTITLDALVPE